MKLVIYIIFILNVSTGFAKAHADSWFNLNAAKQAVIHVDLFFVSKCPSCHNVDVFFQELEKNEPWVEVHRYVINQDRSALQLFYARLHQQHSLDFVTPTIFFCDSRWVGFGFKNGSNNQPLLKGLTYCRQKIQQQGQLSQGTVQVLRQWSAANNMLQSNSPLYYQRLNQVFSLVVLVGILLWICTRQCYQDKKSLGEVTLNKRALLLIGLIVLLTHLI